jgi:DNA polymerase-1
VDPDGAPDPYPEASGKSGESGNCPAAADYRLVTDPEGLEAVLSALGDVEVVAVDVETTGLDSRKDKVRLLQVGVPTIEAGTFVYVIDCFRVDPTPLFPALAERVLVGHNLVFDLNFLAALGFVPGRVRDTMLLSQLLYGTRKRKGYHTLGEVAERELGRKLNKAHQNSDWSGELSAEQLAYAAADAHVLLPLLAALEEKVKALGELAKAAATEHRCLPAMSWLARSGVLLDREGWEAQARQSEEEAEDIARRLDEAAPPRDGYLQKPGAWNWSSPEQVKAALALVGCKLKATDDDSLAAAGHPLAEMLRGHRAASKRASTYGLDWLEHVAGDGRVYAGWKQIGADSGRMSCTSPNLQNLPRGAAYRNCFRAPPGRVLLKADYSQIELRIAAKIAGDSAMLDAYRRGEDLHALTATRVLGVKEVTKEQRQLAKALNFGLLYGMGAPGFRVYAKSQYGVDLTMEQAREYRAAFFRAYPELAWWHRRVKVLHESATWTLGGRQRKLDPKASDTLRLNSPVQGTGADGLKEALARLWETQDECPGAFPVLAVHDEVVIEADTGQAEAAAGWVRRAMVDAMGPLIAPVPVEVEVKVGTTWGG